MCGRYALTSSAETLVELFRLAERPEIAPRYNIAPTQDAPVVRVRATESATAEHRGGTPRPRIEMLRWGLVPFYAADPARGPGMINARAETAATTPAYRRALERRRCLVPADGFFEWRTLAGKVRQPYFIRRGDGRPMAFAGLWEYWKKREGAPPEAPEKIVSFTILTTEPNDVVRPLHDRMPLVIEPRDFALWLDLEMRDVTRLEPLYRPADAAAIEVHAVSRRVNTPANDDPACIAPIPDVAPPDEDDPGLLF